MAREKEDYRPILEALEERFPEKYLLSVTDVALFLGCCRATVTRRYLPFQGRQRRATTKGGDGP